MAETYSHLKRAAEKSTANKLCFSCHKEALKKKLISNWSELDKRGEKLLKEMKEILKDAGATETQIEWGINLPKLSWRKEKRMRELETELKDVLVEMTAVKGAEEALKRMKDKGI